MNKQTLLTVAAFIIAIVFGVLYFLKEGSSGKGLTAEQLEKIKIVLKNNPNYFNGINIKFNKRKDYDEAVNEMTKLFLDTSKHAPYYLSFKTDSIRNYINSADSFIANNLPPTNYSWEIGFYPIEKLDSTTNKYYTDFCVMPSLISNNIALSKTYNMLDKNLSKNPNVIKAKALLYDYSNLQP